jgi:KipI family sensor histidine kinase inhibitor
MSEEPIRVTLASDHSLLVTFGDAISSENGHRVLRLVTVLRERAIPGVVNLHPAYASLLVRFDPLRLRGDALADEVRDLLPGLERAPVPPPRRVMIPVRYGGTLGPDLPAVARHCGLSEDEVVRRHAGGDYEVRFLGFTPGFPYLAGLDPSLSVPRLSTPRTRVPAGSVAIGGSQAGVYPLPSPGGWRLIGWTELRLFDPGREPAALLRLGDRVRFVAETAVGGPGP